MTERVPTGITRLDEMLSGGFISGSSVLVRGAPGTGKTTFALNYLHHGATARNEAGLFVSFEEFPRSLYRDADSLELDIRTLEEKGIDAKPHFTKIVSAKKLYHLDSLERLEMAAV